MTGMEVSNAAASAPERLDAGYLDKLMPAVADGDYAAFEVVFAELSFRVYRAALVLIRDPAQAEEVAQDVFIEIWQHAARYDPAKSSVVAWVLMITRSRAIDRVRSVTAGTRRERETAFDAVPWDEVSETADDASDREQLRAGLGTLNGAQREVILLAFYAGYSHSEIAVVLDIPVGTVKSRLRSALARLRDWMRTAGLPDASRWQRWPWTAGTCSVLRVRGIGGVKPGPDSTDPARHLPHEPGLVRAVAAVLAQPESRRYCCGQPASPLAMVVSPHPPDTESHHGIGAAERQCSRSVDGWRAAAQ
jgi:RNA polymerase sigma-70 factor, ECF subfamily